MAPPSTVETPAAIAVPPVSFCMAAHRTAKLLYRRHERVAPLHHGVRRMLYVVKIAAELRRHFAEAVSSGMRVGCGRAVLQSDHLWSTVRLTRDSL
mgnify:CR=1 FL=1